MTLKRKQAIQHEDFLEAFRNAKRLYSRTAIDNLIDDAAAEIRRTCAGRRTAYAWSGGKDSQALRLVCERAGIQDCVLVMCNLEYPAFLAWVTDNMPPGLEVVNTGQDLAWLARNQRMIFPQDSATCGKWFQIVQHRGQAKFFQDRDLHYLLLGRRRKDGNFCGGPTGVYTNSRGVTRYCPIRDWSHEAVFAAIAHYDLPLPPVYDWPRGFRTGTGPWPARMWTGSAEVGWAETWEIDPSLVRAAAGAGIESARAWLARGGLS